jgi:hypothetical protein
MLYTKIDAQIHDLKLMIQAGQMAADRIADKHARRALLCAPFVRTETEARRARMRAYDAVKREKAERARTAGLVEELALLVAQRAVAVEAAALAAL